MSVSRFLVVLSFIGMGLLSRFLPHPPNFTAVTAMALMGGIYFGSRSIALLAVLSTVILSDIVIGFHSTLFFVYLSFGLITYFGDRLKDKISFKTIPAACIASSLFFFVVTNFGEWLTGSLYSKTLEGLGLCYLAATPFLLNQIVGDLAYGAMLFSLSYLLEHYFTKSKNNPAFR